MLAAGALLGLLAGTTGLLATLAIGVALDASWAGTVADWCVATTLASFAGLCVAARLHALGDTVLEQWKRGRTWLRERADLGSAGRIAALEAQVAGLTRQLEHSARAPFVLRDACGRKRIALGLTEAGEPSLLVFDESEHVRIELGMRDGSSLLMLRNPESKSALCARVASEKSGLAMMSPGNGPWVHIAATDPAAWVTVLGSKDGHCAELLGREGGAAAWVVDRERDLRAGVISEDGASPCLFNSSSPEPERSAASFTPGYL